MDKNLQYILAAAACVLVLYFIMSPFQQCKRDVTAGITGSVGGCYQHTNW